MYWIVHGFQIRWVFLVVDGIEKDSGIGLDVQRGVDWAMVIAMTGDFEGCNCQVWWWW